MSSAEQLPEFSTSNWQGENWTLGPGQLSQADGGVRQFELPVFETSERARSGSVYPSQNGSMDYSTSDVAIVQGQRCGLESAAQMIVPITMQPA